MPSPLDGFVDHKIPDWRASLAANSRKTFFVIISFLLIYLVVGILIDLYLYADVYPQATLLQILTALTTLHIYPIATFITFTIAIISLWVTYSFGDRLMLLGTEYREITPASARAQDEQQLYNVVEEMKIASGLTYMPKVYLIEADYMNAFASGFSEKSAMVAITRGLIEKLDRNELQAVMAHELSHIKHSDIKLTLTASVLSNLILMLVDMIFYASLFNNNRREGKSRNLFLVIMVIRYVLPLVTMLLNLYLSRTREYMADAGCIELMRDNKPLASALMKISLDHQSNREAYSMSYQQTPHETVRRQAYIFDPIQAGIEPVKSFSDTFSTHPSLEKRLAALGYYKSKNI